MIARLWRGQALLGDAEAYCRHVTQTVFPSLRYAVIAARICCAARSVTAWNSPR